jgi:alkylresorcinol/alkylpyrone synthase
VPPNKLASGRVVLLLVVELCALTFRSRDMSKSNMIASALFGDGAAALVLRGDGPGPCVGVAGEHTWPDSLGVMGWQIEDDGLGVVFSRDIPTLTRTEFADLLAKFLDRHRLTLADIDEFITHPGGAKVLDALEDAFALGRGDLVHARSVLRDYGNMSAATVLFVLHRALEAGGRGRMLLSALGPGYTAAFATLDAP